ncbi:FkbM family methyltransferase [Roseicyclus marinus]|uniref:FkbM family methyltransferase n=1 Tax=Roseicyclus marinus TaxID=2161673 RepID=UPI00240EAB14|nr:FkbM family methyltransferase [Roseicyclus marinus]MDG3039721.1 FkbM family methyltransferase [Roseicyclus marinus]
MPDTPRPNAAKGIARSLRVYHRDADRTRRMDALNGRFVGQDGLVFDIGAHVGDRVASFRRLGARVVAIEPQPAAMRVLRLLFRADPGVTLVSGAVGAEPGTAQMFLNTANPTVSTLSRDFIAAAEGAPGWEGQTWDTTQEVAVTTLDALIAAHGLPDFVKIDVEGHEPEVLRGLTQALPALSFEITTIQRDPALHALETVARLGDYRFNLSLGEDHALTLQDWVDAASMAKILRDLPHEANSGDVYARKG